MADEGKSAFRTLSALLNRYLLAARAGLQFDNKRDLYEVFGYKKSLEYQDFLVKYRRQDVARRIVDAPAASTWTGVPTIVDDEVLANEIKALERNIPIWNFFDRADRLAGLGRYSVLLVGFDDGRSLEEPVSGATSIVYMQPFAEPFAQIEQIVGDPTDPRFGMPEFYQLSVLDTQNVKNFGAGIETTIPTRHFKVHASRVLHIADGATDSPIFGIPRLEPVYNLLDDLLKVAGGSAEVYWLNASKGMQADVDKDMEFSEEDAKALSDELDEYHHQLRRFIRTRGVKLNVLKSEIPDPRGTFDTIIALISGATGIPRRILLGSEVGQLASEQDRANWSDRVSERQTDFGEFVVVRPFISLCVNAGVLPESSTYTIEWPHPFRLSPIEEADVAAKYGRYISSVSNQLKGGFPVVNNAEARQFIGLKPEPLIGTPLEDLVMPPQDNSPNIVDDGGEDDDDTNETERPRLVR